MVSERCKRTCNLDKQSNVPLLLLSLAQDQEEDQEELLVGDIFQALVCYGTTDALIHSIHSLHYRW